VGQEQRAERFALFCSGLAGRVFIVGKRRSPWWSSRNPTTPLGAP
jgi:hypothetical protein